MVRVITREDLKGKMDRGDHFKLVMAMDQWHFEAARIPGSVLLSKKTDAPSVLRKDEEIVVYCSEESCYTSRSVADYLERAGYARVSHYPGGLQDWEAAGYPLEGTQIAGRPH